MTYLNRVTYVFICDQSGNFRICTTTMKFQFCMERSNWLDMMQLHVRLGNRGIQAGCLEWWLRFDSYQCCKHHRGNHSAFASTKKAHFPIVLIRESMMSIWTLSIWPSSVDFDDVKHLLSDRILTLDMAKLTICSGMYSLSAWEEIISFLLCFILPLSLVPYMPSGCLIFFLHAILFSGNNQWNTSNDIFWRKTLRLICNLYVVICMFVL